MLHDGAWEPYPRPLNVMTVEKDLLSSPGNPGNAKPPLRARRRHHLWWLLLVALAVLGAGMVTYETDPLPWAYSDSVEYVVSARNFIRGRGLGLFQASGDFSPMTHFPPLYSQVLSSSALLHTDPLRAAGWLNAASLAIFVVLVGLFAEQLLPSSLLALALAAASVISPGLIHIFGGAISEPLFLPLTLGSTLLTLKYAEGGSEGHFVGAVFLASLAALTRYAGLSLALSGPLILMLLSTRPFKRRLVEGILFALVTALPVAAWAAYIRMAHGGAPPREVALVVGGLWVRLQGFRGALVETLWSMIPFSGVWSPLGYRTKLAILALATVAYMGILVPFIVRARRRSISEPRDRSALTLASLAVMGSSYIVFLGVASFAALPAPDIDFRMLSPVLVPLWMSTAGLFVLGRRRVLSTLAVALSVLAVAAQGPATWAVISRLHATGEGYTSVAWRSSALVEAVRSLPEGIPLISNESAAILLLADRPAYDIPELINRERRGGFLSYGSDSQDPIARKFRSEGAALVLFDSIRYQLEPIYGSGAEARVRAMVAGLRVFADVGDGAIYFYPGEEN